MAIIRMQSTPQVGFSTEIWCVLSSSSDYKSASCESDLTEYSVIRTVIANSTESDVVLFVMTVDTDHLNKLLAPKRARILRTRLIMVYFNYVFFKAALQQLGRSRYLNIPQSQIVPCHRSS